MAAVAEGPLVIVGHGDGGIDQMREFVDDSTVQFGLARFEFGSANVRRSKVIFFHISGKRCSVVARGQLNEHQANTMQVLRGKAHSFDASVEFTKKKHVTTENVMAHVLKTLTTDDVGEYSVQWLMKTYQQFIEESARTGAAAPTSSENVARKLWDPGHRSASLYNSGRDALKAVALPLGQWNWVLLKPDPDALLLVEGGAGSVDEMRDCAIAHDKEVLFGLLRMGFGVGRLRRTKYIFVQAIGSQVPAFTRGTVAATRAKMEKAMAQFASSSVAVEFDDPADFSLEKVIDRVRQASVIDDDELDPDKAGKSMFSVEHFRAALAEEHRTTCSVQEQSRVHGGFGDKTVEEVVELVRTPGALENWALFAHNENLPKRSPSSFQNRAPSFQKPPSSLQTTSQNEQPHKSPRPSSSSFLPQGGFQAAQVRAAGPIASTPSTVSTAASSTLAHGRASDPLPSSAESAILACGTIVSGRASAPQLSSTGFAGDKSTTVYHEVPRPAEASTVPTSIPDSSDVFGGTGSTTSTPVDPTPAPPRLRKRDKVKAFFARALICFA